MTTKTLGSFEPTDKQVTCRHSLLREILTTFGIAYKCEECELIFEEPDVRMAIFSIRAK